jgi:tetratricopeptide (TPR) repeat protein
MSEIAEEATAAEPTPTKVVDAEGTGATVEKPESDGEPKMTAAALRSQTDYSKFDKVEDVPEDESPLSLALALKTTGNQKFKAADYKGAVEEYSDALNLLANQDQKLHSNKDAETKEEEKKCRLAILSNRAVCYNNLRNFTKAKEDCDTILKDDEEHIKALFRRGEAYMSMSENVKAYKDMYQVIRIDPKNKAAIKRVKELRKLVHKRSLEAVHEGVQKAEKQKEQKRLKAERDKAKKAAQTKADQEFRASKKSTPRASNAKRATSKKGAGSDDSDDDDVVIEDQTDEAPIRGYKKTSDGRTTSYFTRELDEDAKKLIGDITPQRLDANAGSTASPNAPRPITKQHSQTSAWNSAGTFEEKDKSEWAKERLKELLLAVTVDAGTISVTKVEKVEGDASIISSRGKIRYVYDLSFEVNFCIVFDDGEQASNDDEKTKKKKLKGVLKYSDVCSDFDEDDRGANGILKSFKRKEDVALSKEAKFSEGMAMLRSEIRNVFTVLLLEFQSL